MNISKESGYIPNEKHYRAFAWACDNKIRVYPVPKNKLYKIIYEHNGKKKTSGKLYPKKELFPVVWEFYLYLYKKFYVSKDN